MHSMPIALEASECSASGPTRMPTPATPSRTPASLLAVSASPAMSRATTSVNSGVEHGGQAGGDVQLTVDDQREGDDVADDGLHDKRPPAGRRRRQAQPEQ